MRRIILLVFGIILGCPIKIVLGWISQETDDLKENKRSYGIPDILGFIPIGQEFHMPVQKGSCW